MQLHISAEIIENVEFFLPGEVSNWSKINEFQAPKNTTVLYFSNANNDFFSISINNFPSSEMAEQKKMQSLISCAEARVLRFQKNPSSMLSETIFEKNGIPSSYIYSRFLVDKDNTITITYISNDINNLDNIRMAADEALKKAKILTPV